jgi:osmotically inducible protein OsmC
MAAKGTAEWTGDLKTGAGTFSAGDSISGGYTFKSRFEDVTLRLVDGAPTISRIDLVTTGDVPNIDADAFGDLAEQAKAGCPVSRALAGVPEITLTATLAS